MFRRTIAAVSSGLLVATILTATAAHANGTQRVTGVALEDATGDVFESIGADDDPGVKTRKPRVDIVRAVVRHGRYALRVRIRLVNLRPARKTDLEDDYSADIRTRSGREFFANVDLSGNRRAGRHQLLAVLPHSDSRPVACPGMTHMTDFHRDLVSMRIPRSCVGRPRWVRLQISTFLEGPARLDPDSLFNDNAHNHREFPSARDFTRRLYRG